MKNRRCLLWMWLFFLPWTCFGQSQEWREITAQDREIKEVPGDPGASAIQLFFADYRDDDARYQFIYHRIKILTEEGKKHANIEIPISPWYHFDGVKGRTIQMVPSWNSRASRLKKSWSKHATSNFWLKH